LKGGPYSSTPPTTTSPSTTIERLFRAAGFDPLNAGGVADLGRIEGPGGDLAHSA